MDLFLATMRLKALYGENFHNHLKLTQKLANIRSLRSNKKKFQLMLIINRKLSKENPGIYLTNQPQSFDQHSHYQFSKPRLRTIF